MSGWRSDKNPGGRASEAETLSTGCAFNPEAVGAKPLCIDLATSSDLLDLRVAAALPSMATHAECAAGHPLANGLRRGSSVWNHQAHTPLPLAPHTSQRRSALQVMYVKFEAEIENLNRQVAEQARNHCVAALLMTHPGVGLVTALATEAFRGDPQPFTDGKALASCVGSFKQEYSSGRRQELGGLSKQGNPLLRFFCVQAGAHAVRCNRDLHRHRQVDWATRLPGTPGTEGARKTQAVGVIQVKKR